MRTRLPQQCANLANGGSGARERNWFGPPLGVDTASFGTAVTLRREDGREQTFRIVGEDEADPAHGTISYVSPLARAVMTCGPGDTVETAGHKAEILDVR